MILTFNIEAFKYGISEFDYHSIKSRYLKISYLTLASRRKEIWEVRLTLLQANNFIECCKTCAKQVHMLFSENELAKMTIEELLHTDEMHRYIKWIQRRQGNYKVRLSRRLQGKWEAYFTYGDWYTGYEDYFWNRKNFFRYHR